MTGNRTTIVKNDMESPMIQRKVVFRFKPVGGFGNGFFSTYLLDC
jgi:hypothetical protein